MTRRASVHTLELQSWWDAGWAHVSRDFAKPDHWIVEWLSDEEPRVPAANRVPEALERVGVG
jgi:hypothetical protein